MEQNYEVKIPNIMNPFTVEVNGESYSFPAGTTQVVNQAVYDVIRNIESMVPTPNSRAGEPSFESLRDKPFGESTEVLFDQRVELVDGETVMFYNLPISDGDLVAVTIDGFKYEANAHVDATGAEVFVNHGGEENPDFFVITSTLADDQHTVIFVPNKASATVKIEKPVIRTIDPKFLTGVLLYADDHNYLFKSNVLSEENKVSMDELLGYAKKGMNVVVTPYAFGESANYYYAVSIIKITYEEPNYARVLAGDAHYYSKERVFNDLGPV